MYLVSCECGFSARAHDSSVMECSKCGQSVIPQHVEVLSSTVTKAVTPDSEVTDGQTKTQ